MQSFRVMIEISCTTLRSQNIVITYHSFIKRFEDDLMKSSIIELFIEINLLIFKYNCIQVSTHYSLFKTFLMSFKFNAYSSYLLFIQFHIIAQFNLIYQN